MTLSATTRSPGTPATRSLPSRESSFRSANPGEGARARSLAVNLAPAWTSPSSSSARPARCRPSQRAPTSLLVRRGGDRLLIDCGEGTQRQLLRSVGLPDVEHVFLTHFHADHFLGLPGMMKTFALRGRDRAAHRLRAARPARPDVATCAGSTASSATSVRARRARRRATRSSSTATGSAPTRSRTASEALGYALVEDDRPGRFDPARARALGVEPGPAVRRAPARRGGRGRRPRGAPEEVMGEPRPGRKLVFTRRHRAVRDDGRGRRTAPSCSSTTAPSPTRRPSGPARPGTRPPARRPRWRARRASRCSRSPTSRRATSAPAIEKEARAVFERTVVPRDFDLIEVPYRERGEPQLREVEGRRARWRPSARKSSRRVEARPELRRPTPLLHSPRRFL